MSYLKRILNNCSETSLLALRSKEEKLPFSEKFVTRFHIVFCKCCRNFEKQSNIIDHSLKEYFKQLDGDNKIKASEDFKAKLKEKLK